MLVNTSLLSVMGSCAFHQQAPSQSCFEVWLIFLFLQEVLREEPCCSDNETPLAFQSQVSIIPLSLEQQNNLV